MVGEGTCNSDLTKERRTCRFVPEEITNLLDNGVEQTKLRRSLENYFLSHPAFKDTIPPEYLSHSERYCNELRKACIMVNCLHNDPTVPSMGSQMESIKLLMGSGLGLALTKDGNPLSLHYIMFLPALVGQSTQEQLSTWMERAWVGDIIGTYAQTELGHGTFLRGLETTATYDPATQEFVLHSPTITSLKWWPGGLGKTANYAIVMAQLYTRGHCHGPHPFLVQLRDCSTHASMPGVTVGEIGPRLGMNTNDNGFLQLEHVRVPRLNMLMKHAQVSESGEYVQPASSKLSYGTMVFVRVAICFDSGRQLRRAVTIATRYSAVRRQGEIVPDAGEVQILDYQTQQDALLPHIATVFAVQFSSRRLWDTYSHVSLSVSDGNLDMLPELHALSCGLKACCSRDCSAGVERCRLACGGHGYLASSNLPRITTTTTATQTYEGENTVMWLQLARYLVKSYRDCRQGLPVPLSVKYFAAPPRRGHDHLTNQGLVHGWQRAAVSLVCEVEERIDAQVRAGELLDRARNATALKLVAAAQVFIRSHMCEQFVNVLRGHLGLSTSTLAVLQRLCRLYLLYHTTQSPYLLRYEWLSTSDVSALEDEYCTLLAELRQDAVSLVDAFDIDDRILDSTLGCWDGRVYERLYAEALRSPLNQQDVSDGFEKYLKPLIKSKL